MTWNPKRVKAADRLYDVAHARSGDKADKLNVVVVPFEDESYDELVRTVTTDRVAEHFGDMVTGDVERHCVPGLSCLNFVFSGALDGGWTRSLRLDRPGKSVSRYMLRLPLTDEP